MFGNQTAPELDISLRRKKKLKAAKVLLKLNQKPALPNHLLITWSASGRYKRIQELKNDIATKILLIPTPVLYRLKNTNTLSEVYFIKNLK